MVFEQCQLVIEQCKHHVFRKYILVFAQYKFAIHWSLRNLSLSFSSLSLSLTSDNLSLGSLLWFSAYLTENLKYFFHFHDFKHYSQSGSIVLLQWQFCRGRFKYLYIPCYLNVSFTWLPFIDHAMLLHSGDTTWPKQIPHGGPQPFSNILYIEKDIFCGIDSHLQHKN